MKVYTMDNMLFTNAKVKDEVVDKIIDTLVKNKADLVAVRRSCATSPPTGLLQEARHALPPRRAEVFQGPTTSRPRRYQ